MSSSSPVPAGGVRVDWEHVPQKVRIELERRLGAIVVEASTQPGGFSPGLASRLRLEDGRRVFVKAVSSEANPDSPDIHRREARIVSAMPEWVSVPRLLWTYDQHGWVALCFEDIDGRHPAEPWTEDDLELVVSALQQMSRLLTPSPIDVDATAADAFVEVINGWQAALDRAEERLDPWAVRHLKRLANLEAQAPAESAGTTLLHFDTRADNLLIAGHRVYVIDWPWARIGAPWIDWVAMALSVAMQGGPAPEVFLRRFDLRGVAKESIDSVLCSVAGYFVVGALAPPPPGLPTLRTFQAAQGVVALRWLRERMGWE